MTSLPHPKTLVELSITEIDEEGRGIARVQKSSQETHTYMVRGAFPNDRVQAQVERVFPSIQAAQCRMKGFYEKGDLHQERTCPHSHPCPGCPLHDLESQAALQLKEQRIRKALSNVGLGSLKVNPIKPQANPTGYRQKVKLMVGGEAGQLVVGLYAPYSHHLVPADACAHVMPQINQALDALISQLNLLEVRPHSPHRLGLKAIIARAAQEGVVATLVTSAPLSPQTFAALKQLVSHGVLAGLYERCDPSQTNSVLGGQLIKQAGLEFITPLEGGPKAHPDSFCQTDPQQAALLYQQVAQYLIAQGTAGIFVDAFAGNGGFTQALLAQGATHLIAIEQAKTSEPSLAALPVERYLEPMADAITHLAGKPISGLVADPPKKGLGALAKPLAQLQAQRFVLVSCDPDAMAQDLSVLLEAGYIVDAIEPFDFFAGTPEVETVVFLRRH